MKFIKFTLSISLILILFISNLSFAHADSKQNSLLDNQREKFKNENVEITQMNQDEINFLKKLQSKDSNIKNFENKMQKEGFKEIPLDAKNSKLKYTTNYTNNKKGYGYIVNSAYKNKNTKEIVISETIYDSHNKKITKFVAEKRNMDNNKNGKLLVNKNYVDNNSQGNNQDQTATRGFKWNGKSFACSMAGLYACAHYCGVWAVVNPIAGGTCEAVCGTAFAAACSVSS